MYLAFISKKASFKRTINTGPEANIFAFQARASFTRKQVILAQSTEPWVLEWKISVHF